MSGVRIGGATGGGGVSYAITIRRAKGNVGYIATDNVSTVYGAHDTPQLALQDYEDDVRNLLDFCARDYQHMTHGLQEECNRVRSARSDLTPSGNGEEQ